MKFAIDQLQALLRRVGLLENRITTLETIESDAGHTHTIGFTNLTDTPTAYTGQGGKLVRVNATPDGLEFADGGGLYVTLTGDQTVAGVKTWSSNAIFGGLVDLTGDALRVINTNGYIYVQNNSAALGVDLLYANAPSQSSGAGHLLRLRSNAVDRVVVTRNGNVGIGTSAPAFKLDVAGTIRTAENPAGFGNYGILMSHNDANPNIITFNQINFSGATQGGFISVNSRYDGWPNWTKTSTSAINTAMFVKLSPEQFGVQFGNATNTGGTTPGTQQFTIVSTGNVGFGVTSPQGRLHGHDGTGGFLFVTKTGVAGSAVTIIPDGTGDVVHGLYYEILVKPSTGNAAGQSTWIAFDGSEVSASIYNVGGNTLTLRINANGSVDVRRTAGSLTYTIQGRFSWL